MSSITPHFSANFLMSLHDRQIFFTNLATFNEVAKATSKHQGLLFVNWRVVSEPKKTGGSSSSPITDLANKLHKNVFNEKDGEKKFTKVVFSSLCNKPQTSSPASKGSSPGSGQSPRSTSSAAAAPTVTRPSTVTSQMSLGEHQILQQLQREPSRTQQPQPQSKITNLHRKANPYRV